jgi:hypothetical protein
MWFPVIFYVLRMRDPCFNQSRCEKFSVWSSFILSIQRHVLYKVKIHHKINKYILILCTQKVNNNNKGLKRFYNTIAIFWYVYQVSNQNCNLIQNSNLDDTYKTNHHIHDLLVRHQTNSSRSI